MSQFFKARDIHFPNKIRVQLASKDQQLWIGNQKCSIFLNVLMTAVYGVPYPTCFIATFIPVLTDELPSVYSLWILRIYR